MWEREGNGRKMEAGGSDEMKEERRMEGTKAGKEEETGTGEAMKE
jgi:hypothetical protein